MKSSHLIQLFEESRYYRTFHDTIFSVSMAFYSGLMILQANILSDVGGKTLTLSGIALLLIKYVIPILFLLMFPCILTYIFINWHFVQGYVRDKIVTLQDELGVPEEFLQDQKYKGFAQKTWIQKCRIGRGHPLFIISLWILVIANGAMFYVILQTLGAI